MLRVTRIGEDVGSAAEVATSDLRPRRRGVPLVSVGLSASRVDLRGVAGALYVGVAVVVADVAVEAAAAAEASSSIFLASAADE